MAFATYQIALKRMPMASTMKGRSFFRWKAHAQEWLLTPKSTAVPEPSTWALMLLGFAGLGLAGYRGAPGTRHRRGTANSISSREREMHEWLRDITVSECILEARSVESSWSAMTA